MLISIVNDALLTGAEAIFDTVEISLLAKDAEVVIGDGLSLLEEGITGIEGLCLVSSASIDFKMVDSTI